MLSSRTTNSILVAGAILLISAGGLLAQPIGTADAEGILVENSTGNSMTVKLQAEQGIETAPGPHQDDHNGGRGAIHAFFRGQSGIPINGCSVHGPGVPGGYDISQNNSGFFPLTMVECGRAGGQTVSIDGCVLSASFHGYVHSDNPRITYLGIATIDLTIHKTNNKVNAEVTVHTPKGPISVKGRFEGTVNISSCQ